jgi:L-threonylcarbamoyladenylate synthase
MHSISHNIKSIAKTLLKGGVIICPTDTIYGISCLADNDAAVLKILDMKKRQKKGFIVLMKDVETAQRYCRLSERQIEYIKKENLDRPTTYILEALPGLSGYVYGSNLSLAARLPKDQFISNILTEVDKPIVSTSLNLSGEPAINDVKDIIDLPIGKAADMIVDAGPAKDLRASRIVDIRDMEEIAVIRE